MAKSGKQEHREDLLTKITKKIEQFIVDYKKVIIVTISVLAVLGAAYFSVQQILTRKERAAESSFSKIYLLYSEANADTGLDDAQLKEKLMTLNEDFGIVLERYPKSSAASRSAYYIGNTLYRYGEYKEALAFYTRGAGIKQRSYSALLCVQGQASCYEQLEDYQNAQERYRYIIEKNEDSFLVPMVRFSLGQIYEKQNRYEDAQEQYNSIVNEYGWSGWADLAEKKILLLKNTAGDDKV
jgi:tetratricopeptide (TPR) repeat protein